MKALVVYESLWGNTREIAETVASGLDRHAAVVTLEVSEAPRVLPGDLDLVVAGGPAHAYSLGAARGLREWLNRLPYPVEAARFALFDVRLGVTRPLPSSSGRRAAGTLTAHGYEIVTEPHTFYVHAHNGALTPSERCRASLWGERVALEAQLDRQLV